MTVKVLHIFAPSYKNRFGGQTFSWKYAFSAWNNPEIEHYFLDFETLQMIPAKEAFRFEYLSSQKGTTRWERTIWVLTLFRCLAKHVGKFDILYVHVLWWGSLLIGPWSKWIGVPAVYESVLLHEDTPGGILRENLGQIKVWLLKYYQGIVAISEYLAEDYRKCGFDPRKVHTLMNSVDGKVFFPVETAGEKTAARIKRQLSPDATILVYVGSVIQRKGVDLLIRAFIDVSSQHSDLYLMIVGPKDRHENPSLDEGFVNGLRQSLSTNRLSTQVAFLGLIQDREELAEIYRASDMFVFPSRNEGLGNVILEAMACGLPVIVSQLPVLEKVVTHGENGFLIPVNDVSGLKDTILTLISEPSLAQKIGQNAHHYIQTRHDFLAWQAELTAFCKGLLA